MPNICIMNTISIKIPKVKTSDAIKFAGSQAKLAKILNISRASVSAWYSENRKYVPELQAYKLVSINPDLDVSEQ